MPLVHFSEARVEIREIVGLSEIFYREKCLVAKLWVSLGTGGEESISVPMWKYKTCC